MTTPPRSAHETLAQRKERLVMQCRAYRAAVDHSRQEIRSKMGIQSIIKSAAGMVGLGAGSAALSSRLGLSRFSHLSSLADLKGGLSVGKLQKLLPLVAAGYSLLARRSLLRPVLRGLLLAGAAGTAAYVYSRAKSRQRHGHDHAAHHERL